MRSMTALGLALPMLTGMPVFAEENMATHILESVNEVRAEAGLNKVVLGNNSAAQSHAEEMLVGCYTSP